MIRFYPVRKGEKSHCASEKSCIKMQCLFLLVFYQLSRNDVKSNELACQSFFLTTALHLLTLLM